MYTVGIIGTGKIAGLFDAPAKTEFINTHAQAIHNSTKLRFVSAVDADKRAVIAFCEKWGIKNAYTELSSFMINDIPDIITVSSSSDTHYSIASRILKHEKRPRVLFIEKPVCCTRIELQKLMEIDDASGTVIVVNHKRRFDPVHVQLKEIVQSGYLGKFIEGSFTYYGGWLNNGVHIIDLIMMLFGGDFRFMNVKRQMYGKQDDLCFDVTLDYRQFQIEMKSFDEQYYQLFEGELRFSKGRVLYQDFGNRIIVETTIVNSIGEVELHRSDGCTMEGLWAPFKHGYKSIVACLDAKDDTVLTGVRLKDVNAVMDKMFMIENT
jgi:predicted dehydrogenase